MAQTSDRGVGLGMLFGIVAVGGAFALLVTSLQGQQVLSGWGFAAAMVAAALAVVAVHVYE
jgi:hypothetical protein